MRVSVAILDGSFPKAWGGRSPAAWACSAASVLLFWVGVSCSPRSATQDELGPEIVARVGEETISREEFEAQWLQRGKVDIPAAEILERRERLLENLIQTKAARQRARMSGFDQQPEIQAVLDQLIASRYLEETFAQRGAVEGPIPETEIAAYYQAHAAEFQMPVKVRAGVILLHSSPKASPENRATARTRAEVVRQEILSTDEASYPQLVQKYSEDQSTRYMGGDTGWLTAGSSASRWDPLVVQAALELKSPGAVAPVIETDTGFYLVRLSQRQEVGMRPLEEVTDVIGYRLRQTMARDREAAIRHELTNGLPIEVNLAVLKDFPQPNSLDTSTPPRLPGG